MINDPSAMRKQNTTVRVNRNDNTQNVNNASAEIQYAFPKLRIPMKRIKHSAEWQGSASRRDRQLQLDNFDLKGHYIKEPIHY